MNDSVLSTSSTMTKNSETSEMKEFKTIPVVGNLQQSLLIMTEEQINFNLIELNMVSMFNEEILGKLYSWSTDLRFYLKNRYLLENILNVAPKPGAKHMTDIREIVQKYDSSYVNGKPFHQKAKDSHIIKHGLKKESRAKFISDRQQFVNLLQQLSSSLLEQQKLVKDDGDLKQYFINQLEKINNSEIKGSISPNKVQLLKNASKQSFSSQGSGGDLELEEISNDSQNFDSPAKQTDEKQNKKKCIFTMCYHDQLQQVKFINTQNSRYIRTKNRFPLILDFGFSKFIYKNDDQLSHELIAMSLIKYVNRILSGGGENTQIVEYQIIPEATGAFYEFVENSMTIGKIKATFAGGVPEYLNHLEDKSFENSKYQMSSIRKKFAQTYAGFSVIQYLLDLKDRNNENIMIRNDGAIFHIDLAFIFNANPGNIGFETAPFKFPKEYLDAMGGFDSDTFKYFQSLMLSNMTKLCINKNELFSKIQILCARRDQILCFKKYRIQNFKQKIPNNPKDVKSKVEKMIDASFDNWRTKKYDNYQFKTNGILA